MKMEIQMKMYDSLSAEMTDMTCKLVEEFIGSAGDGVWLQAVSLLSGLSWEDMQAVAQKEKSISVSEMTAFLTGVINADNYYEEMKTGNFADPGDYMHVLNSASTFLRDWTEGIHQIMTYTPAFSDFVLQSADAVDDEKMLEKYHLFMDAGSLCETGMSKFIDKIIVTAKTSGNIKRVIVPKAVIKTIMKLTEDSKESQLMGAYDGMKNLQKLQNAGLLSIRGDEGDVTVLSTFVSAFSRFKPVNNMILLTYDNTLSEAVKMLNRSGIEGDDILVACVNEYGTAEGWDEEKTESSASSDKELFPKKSEEELTNEQNKSTGEVTGELNGSTEDPADEPNKMAEESEYKSNETADEPAGEPKELYNNADVISDLEEIGTDGKTEWMTENEEIDEEFDEDSDVLLDGFESSSWNIIN